MVYGATGYFALLLAKIGKSDSKKNGIKGNLVIPLLFLINLLFCVGLQKAILQEAVGNFQPFGVFDRSFLFRPSVFQFTRSPY